MVFSIAEGRSLTDLADSLKAAVEKEDYTAAAAIKREIQEMEMQDPRKQLEAKLQQAVKEENYEVGACPEATNAPP